MTNVKNPFMERAIALATENAASGRGGPFAAVIVKDGRIVAEGVNLVTSTNDPTAHAEVVAIRAACTALKSFQLTGCEVYTSCEPCPMCLGAIYWARPLRIYFGNTYKDAAEAGFDDSFIYQQLRIPNSERHIPMIPMMRDEALESFRAWQQTQNKILY